MSLSAGLQCRSRGRSCPHTHWPGGRSVPGAAAAAGMSAPSTQQTQQQQNTRATTTAKGSVCSPSPCGGKVDGLDGAIPAALLALEQQVHQLNTLALNKGRPEGRAGRQAGRQAACMSAASTTCLLTHCTQLTTPTTSLPAASMPQAVAAAARHPPATHKELRACVTCWLAAAGMSRGCQTGSPWSPAPARPLAPWT